MTNSTARKIAAAARRLLDRQGADAVTLRKIAKAVGITPMAVYRHYTDRASLLAALADEGFAELAAELTGRRFSGNIEKRLMEMADIYLDHALENPRLFELMFLRPREGARKFPQDFKAGLSPTANPTVKVIEEGMKSGYFREDDPWEIVFEMGGLSHGLIMLYLGGRMDVSAEEFRAVYRRSFRRYLHGICK
jgi:AcrR family transcriptional regulator